MTLLITGSNGFVGKNFLRLFNTEYHIFTFSFLNDNINYLSLESIDVVVHLGGVVHAPLTSALEYTQRNVFQTIELAKKAKEGGVSQFIFMSSIAIHGDTVSTIDEFTPINPTTPYGKSKAEAEQELLALQDKNFKISIVRSPMIYGYDAPGNIKALLELIRNVPLLPFRGINNYRSFVYIDNLSTLIHTIIKQQKEGIFLAADDTPISTTDLIIEIAKAVGKPCLLFKIPFFPILLKKLKPQLYQRLFESLIVDNSHTKRVLTFENPYSTQEGIRHMIHGENLHEKSI